MGTHPIFESDFDCLTDLGLILIKNVSITPVGHHQQVQLQGHQKKRHHLDQGGRSLEGQEELQVLNPCQPRSRLCCCQCRWWCCHDHPWYQEGQQARRCHQRRRHQEELRHPQVTIAQINKLLD